MAGLDAGDDFDDSIADKADPEIEEKSEIELLGTMLSGRGQQRHQQDEINRITANHRDERFREVGSHTGLDTDERQ